ncbi:MAG TPA: c-type cytochrome [Rhodanobacteraceae bacterium]|nr:c-type cytochrome [Rhodanobacteraceae bacterium]
MGFRRPFALAALIAAVAPIAVALAVAPAQDAPASAGSAAPASGAAASANAAKAAEDALAKLEAVPTQPGNATVGKTKAVTCGACHGADGNSTDPQYPKLAAQSEQYIVAQLMHFKSGVRQNAIMAGMAATLSPQDMHDIAAYFSEQKRKPGVADPKLAAAGSTLYREGNAKAGVPACMACHGPDGAGNPGWRVPNIGGQHAQYVAAQLKAWHDGTTWGSSSHAMIMPTIAKNLTPGEIAAVSSYVEGLHAATPVDPGTNAAASPTD